MTRDVWGLEKRRGEEVRNGRNWRCGIKDYKSRVTRRCIYLERIFKVAMCDSIAMTV